MSTTGIQHANGDTITALTSRGNVTGTVVKTGHVTLTISTPKGIKRVRREAVIMPVSADGQQPQPEGVADPQMEPMPHCDLVPDLYNHEVMGAFPLQRMLGRVFIGGIRHYVCLRHKADRPDFLPGASGIEDKVSPVPTHLAKWRMDMLLRFASEDAVEGFVDETAAFGTVMHAVNSLMMQGIMPEINSKAWVETVSMLIHQQDGRDPLVYFPLWNRKLIKSLCAWKQFMQDKNVKVHFIEMSMGDAELGYAVTIDICCTLDFAGKRVNAIIDEKSGKIQKGGEKASQLALYKMMFNKCFGGWEHEGKPLTHLFNWAPLDWDESKGVPTYELVNQTDIYPHDESGPKGRHWRILRKKLELFHMKHGHQDHGMNTRTVFEGKVMHGKPISQNMRLITLAEEWMGKIGR